MTQYGMIMMQSCTDQGDTSSPDWLDLKVLIGTQGCRLIPIKFAFALITTTSPSSPMAFHNTHGSSRDHFTCSTPWHTGCIEGFFETKKGIKNATESVKLVSKFCDSKSVIKFELLLG